MGTPQTLGKNAPISRANAPGIASAKAFRAVTPDDYGDLPDGPADFLWVTANGNLNFRPEGWPSSSSLTIAVLAGQKIPCRVKRVLSTSTTATVVAAYDESLDDDTAWGALKPILSDADASPSAATTGDGVVTTDQDGGTVYMVVTESVTPPTAAQVIAGQNDGGTAAVFDDSAAGVAGVMEFPITGLTTATAYYAYFCHVSANGDRSAVAASGLFTTP